MGPQIDYGRSDFLTKQAPTFHNKIMPIHENNLTEHYSASSQSDPAMMTIGGQQSNLYGYGTMVDYDSHYLMKMEAYAGEALSTGFSLNQPENSYDFSDIVSISYSPDTQFSTKIETENISQQDTDFGVLDISGKRINNSPHTDSNSASNSEDFQ